MVLTGETPGKNVEDDVGIGITVQEPVDQPQALGGGSAEREVEGAGGEGVQPGEEHRELVIANQSRLHPGERK